jgi:hypothetical protein
MVMHNKQYGRKKPSAALAYMAEGSENLTSTQGEGM